MKTYKKNGGARANVLTRHHMARAHDRRYARTNMKDFVLLSAQANRHRAGTGQRFPVERVVMKQARVALTAVLIAGCSGVSPTFNPTAPLAPGEFSHRSFEQVLETHVRDGLVNYQTIQADPRFIQYLAQLDRVDPNAFSREDRLALWINAYNAYAIKGILDGYSPSTIIGRYRYFIGREYRIGGETLNLYDLERQVLIAKFHEPRMHFAIVCASASCPKLQPWVYEGAHLSSQLDQVARLFINDTVRNRFDRTTKTASLSMIFKWFEGDFAGSSGSILDFIAQFVDDPQLAEDLRQAGYQVEFLEYDWSLNGIPPAEMIRAGSS